MFVISMKTTRPRAVTAAAVVLALIVTVTALSFGGGALATTAPVKVDGEAGCVAYLQSLGYQVGEGEVREVLIPAELDETFAAYNAMLQAAGMDLTPYRGKRVKCWTYPLADYPGEGPAQVHLYVYKDQVIGGDVSSVAPGGFTRGLEAMTPGA